MTSPGEGETAEPRPERGHGALGALGSSPSALLGLLLVLFWLVVALAAPLISPFDPYAMDFDAVLEPQPAGAHLLGTDMLGRDVLARLIWGARALLLVVPPAVVAAYLVGVLLGLVAGYFGGWIDQLLMRLSDGVLSFPVLILYMIVLAHFGPSAFNVVLAVAFTAAPQIARIVRGLTLELKTRDFVAAARLRRESAWSIMLVEILPNAWGPVGVDACLRLGYTTIIIGVLGFLGLGLPPEDPNWGGMVKDTYPLIGVYPHMALFPCAALSSLVIGFNLLADGLREVMRHG